MGRDKVKNTALPMELQIDIQAQFEKLMQFYHMGGLTMPRESFYAVLRGDECMPNDVLAVELAYTNVLQLEAMSNKELVQRAIENIRQDLFDKEPGMRRHLQILVGKLLFAR